MSVRLAVVGDGRSPVVERVSSPVVGDEGETEPEAKVEDIATKEEDEMAVAFAAARREGGMR